jgi:LemA protein
MIGKGEVVQIAQRVIPGAPSRRKTMTESEKLAHAVNPFCYPCDKSYREIAMRKFFTVLATLSCLSLTNCGYNAIQTNDEQVKSSWSEVVNQYQRRADLVPNLVNSVKGFAQQEKDVLLGVTNARAKVGSIQATPEVLNDPAAFQKFTQAQGELSSALSRLLVVTENYPQLKSDALFKDLMAQLEGTENRITVARNRYIKSVQEYNVGIRTFPNNLTAMVFGYKEKPNFSVENEKEISVAPKVDFNPTPAPTK